jgi:hypothetical protein
MPPTAHQPSVPGYQYQDDAGIPDDVRLLRRIPGGRYTEKEGRAAPNSDCFKDSSDGTGASVDIWEDDWSPEKSLEAQPEHFGLVSFTAGQLRALGLGIIRMPLPDNPHHATLQGPKTTSVLRRLAKHCEWQKLASPIPPEQVHSSSNDA